MYVSRVKILAEEQGLTESDLVQKTGYSHNTIRRWVNNDPPIIRADAKKVKAFVDVFGLANWWEVFEPELYIRRVEHIPIKE